MSLGTKNPWWEAAGAITGLSLHNLSSFEQKGDQQ